MNSSTAGKGDPYWYEWTVGLLKVVEMLRPESKIQSVSFQVTGAKGWDDVVVRYSDGRTDYIQVKHSRVNRSITFGNLVGTDEEGTSLLGSLFDAWKAMELMPGRDKCILFTNRSAGESIGRSSAGVTRPPLFEFITWLECELKRVESLGECQPPCQWEPAWKEWREQLANGTPVEQVSFLKSFVVCPNQDDLLSLEASVLAELGNAFQIPSARARPLFYALDSALRRWTTSKETVSAEDAFTAMAVNGDVEPERLAPPPPAPFFPSRRTALTAIEAALANPRGSPLIFLCAEPGAGKTSLISELANRRVSQPLQGLVGLRYFAFRPITPQSPLIPPDADHFVRPDRLWFSLLSQLRQGLIGKLRDYQVPLRNNLLDWPEARSHVLRIADRLGNEMKRPFVIAIDGIDHAARAARYEGGHAKDFFASLPGPDEIGTSMMRLMLAGQPPEAYPEYPAWLLVSHPNIRTFGIGKLDAEDIVVLLRTAKSPIPEAQERATVSVIETSTSGNTLAVVFAVEEARTCNSADELKKRLAERHLEDGLREYYKAIWQHALSLLEHTPAGTEIALASALCLTAERLTGNLMASAFKQLGLSSHQWQFMLGSLGPLLVEDADGFRVLHNDVRIFLHGHLSDQPMPIRRLNASMLAEYYLSPISNRWIAHKSLCRLLRDAGREVEWARAFTVDWVLEAAALRIPYSEMSGDCADALRQGTVLKDWDVMLELVCATETLERWEEKCDTNQALRNSEEVKSTPEFLHTEAFVPPFAEWSISDLHDLTHDAEILVARDEDARARALLERWLNGLSIEDLCSGVAGLVEPTSLQIKDEPSLSMGSDQTLESLGDICRCVGYDLKNSTSTKSVPRKAQSHFEMGWVKASCDLGPFDSIETCFSQRPIHYFTSFKIALENLAFGERWPLVRAILLRLAKSKDRLSASSRAQAAWCALRSEAALDDPEWIEILDKPYFGFPENRSGDLNPALAICHALNWRDAAAEPGAVAHRVYIALRCDAQNEKHFQHYKLLFRAAATMGRVLSILNRKGGEAAGGILPAHEIARLAKALWDFNFDSHTSHQHKGYAGQLVLDLVNVAFQLGEEHRNALLKISQPIVEKWPVDYRRESLWLLLKRSGNISKLREWLRRWLDDDGWLWMDDAGSRESIASDLLPLAHDLGEDLLAKRAEDRLRWLQITYRCHKEYSLGTPISWFTELTRNEPERWRDLGLRLWGMSEACSELGGDNRCEWELGEALGAAAWACGPVDVFRLLTTDYPRCGSDYWFNSTANRIIGGLTQYLLRHADFPWRDRVSGWCLAVGMSRWFNNDSIKTLVSLRESLLASAPNETERSNIITAIEQLTPNEFRRAPSKDGMKGGALSSEAESEDLDDWLLRVGRGDEIHPCIAARLLRQTLSDRPAQFNAIANRLLGAVGVGAPCGWGWYASESYHDAILDIGRIVSDESLWNLVKSAVKYAGDGNWWAQGTCRNLHCVLLSRAAKSGAPALRSGMSRVLDMHERWARGGQGDLLLPRIALGRIETITSWSHLAAQSLTFLLSSRSGEVIQSALVGIHSLVSHDPSVIGDFIKLADDDLWKQYWILNAAEVWATRFPNELESCRGSLNEWLNIGPLHRRLQTWIVLRQLAQSKSIAPPPFPHPMISGDEKQSLLHQIPHEILSTPAIRRGSIRFIDHHHSAESIIHRVEYATSADLAQVKHEVARQLMEASAENFDAQPWPIKVRSLGDSMCSSLQCNLILDEAFDGFLREFPLPAHLQGTFAQAYLGNEDPWILRATPVPDTDSSAWPGEMELRDAHQNPANFEKIRHKLYLLSTQHKIADDELALAGQVQIFTYQSDVIFRFWWEEGSPDTRDTPRSHCPTTMSGRMFAVTFDDWWEPRISEGTRPLAFAVGGHQRLSNCFPEFMPSRLWRNELQWRPARGNLLLWVDGDQPVARYELIHAHPRFTHSGHPRQPLLGRWIMKKFAWEKLVDVLGPLRERDDFRQFSSNVES